MIAEAQNDSIEVKTIAVDFTESQTIYPKLKAELDKLEIGILVNNVGMLIGFRPFADFVDDQGFHDMVICNTIPVTRMSHIVLQQMVKLKRGTIINLSSLSAAGPSNNTFILFTLTEKNHILINLIVNSTRTISTSTNCLWSDQGVHTEVL